MFVALRGERFDGHAYLTQAADRGATMLMIDDATAAADAVADRAVAVLRVDDTLAALGRLAAAYRRQLGATVIAVTGSAGKTTTKAMIDSVLAARLTGRASPKSFNNNIGVPLTLLAAQPADQYLIVEVGTNAPGEIDALGALIKPDIAVITHAGRAHLEGLGDVSAVACEKASLLNHLTADDLAVINGDVPELIEQTHCANTVRTFGQSAACDVRLVACQSDTEGVHFELADGAAFDLPMLGAHNAVNALAAIAIGRHMKLTDTQIAEGLRRVPALDGRLTVQRLGPEAHPLVLLNDAYNANPDSMAAALGTLCAYPASGRRVAILGDMLELGDQAVALHEEVGRYVGQARVDLAVFIGPLSVHASSTARQRLSDQAVHAFETWADDTADRVAALLTPGDTALIKASRLMQLERLIPAIERHLAGLPTETGNAV